MMSSRTYDATGVGIPLVAFLTLLATGALYWPIALNLDVSYYASVGKIISQGQVLYHDYLEGNPPGPVLVAQLSHALSGALRTPFDQTHKYVLFALQSSLYLMTLAVLWPRLRRAGASGLVFTAGLGLVAVMLTPAIGRRDYIGPLLMLPWAVSILMAWTGTRPARVVALPVGAAAGLAMLFKPHFAALALAIGIVDLVRARGRPGQLLAESWIALVSCLVSYAWFALAYPVYFTEIIPFALETFGRMSPGPAEALRRLGSAEWVFGGLVVMVAGAVLVRRADRGNRWLGPVVLITVLAGGAALSVYAIQGFGLAYQLLPLRMTVFVALFALGSWAFAAHRAAWIRAGGLLLCAGLAAYLARPFFYQPSRTYFAEHALTRAMTPDTSGAPILMVSSSVRPAGQIFPFIDASWSGVSLVHWPIVTLIRQDGRYGTQNHVPEDRRRELAEWYRGRMAERLAASPPERVAIDVSDYLRFFEESDFDILAWLREHPGFDTAWRAAVLEPYGAPVEMDGRRFRIYRATGR